MEIFPSDEESTVSRQTTPEDSDPDTYGPATAAMDAVRKNEAADWDAIDAIIKQEVNVADADADLELAVLRGGNTAQNWQNRMNLAAQSLYRGRMTDAMFEQVMAASTLNTRRMFGDQTLRGKCILFGTVISFIVDIQKRCNENGIERQRRVILYDRPVANTVSEYCNKEYLDRDRPSRSTD